MTTSNVIRLASREGRTLARHEPIGVLDIGTSKMCCLIARRREDEFEVLGAGYQLAEGLRAGDVVDAEATEASILAIVHEAEQQAGRTLRQVVLGIAAGRPHSLTTTVEIELNGRAVKQADLWQALIHARAGGRADNLEVLHTLPIEIRLDGGPALRDPRGMTGDCLAVRVHMVQVGSGRLHNLLAAVERCHLEVGAVVAGPYAAGLASLSEEELALGALVLDLGAGVTGVARLAHGRLQEIHTVPMGAQHITQDLAFGLSIGRAHAERMKTLFGSVLASASALREELVVPGLGDPGRPPEQIVTRARLTEIIRPRLEEIFQLIRARLDLARLPVTARRLVLTGGGSQLEGAVDLAEDVFEMPARLGRPIGLTGLELPDWAAATTAAGLLRWAARDDGGLAFGAVPGDGDITTRLARIGQWLRENF